MSHVAGGPAPEVPAREDSVPDDGPYTIRCICTFDDDDGATVFCERCETWQHIDCYYPTRKVPEVHNCVDCEPRPLDVKRALERQQRRRREQDNGPERKARRPPAKVARRKPKDAAATAATGHVNGCPSDRRNGVARDQPPPAKRPKTTHRTSNSIASHPDLKRTAPVVPGPEARQAHVVTIPAAAAAAVVSPPDSHSDSFSPQLGHRPDYFGLEYAKRSKAEPDDSPRRANVFSNIAITSSMASWIHDGDALRQATHGQEPADVFERVDGAFESLEVPELVKHTKEAPVPNGTDHGPVPSWSYLTVESSVPAGGLVGEIKGEVGHLQDYYQEATGRGLSVRYPEPFVFFHPQLPIYIDTRREGTRCRYVRRSCRPSVKMRTLISNGTDYHFCLCAIQDLEAGKELSLGWDHDDEMRALLDRAAGDAVVASPVKSEKLSPAEQDEIASWVEFALETQGGCACEDATQCTLARLDHRRGGDVLHALQPWPDGVKHKKVRNGLPRRTPPSNGVIGTSRAGSELQVPREHDEDHHDESRSTSGSFPSKPQSRDITPLTHLSGDIPMPTPGSEMSDRERRKLAVTERNFEQLEQGHQHPPHRRKKRNNSQAVTVNSGAAAAAPMPASASMSGPSAAGVASPDVGPLRQSTARSSSASQPATPSAVVKSEQAEHSPLRGMENGHAVDAPTGPAITPTAASPTEALGPEAVDSRPLSYVDSDVQTDAAAQLWHHRAAPSTRRPIASLKKQLLLRCHADQVRHGTERQDHAPVSSETAVLPAISTEVDMSDQDDVHNPPPPASSHSGPHDGSRPDGDSVQEASDTTSVMQWSEPIVQRPRPPDLADEPWVTSTDAKVGPLEPPPLPPPPLPARNNTIPEDSSAPTAHPRSVGLRVQLPPAPNFHCPSPSTPSSATGSMAQSPQSSLQAPVPFSPSVIGSITQPSPIKKKMSLSDYVSRRKEAEAPGHDKGPTSGASGLTNPLPRRASSPVAAEARWVGPGDGPGVGDAPKSAEASMALSASAADARLTR